MMSRWWYGCLQRAGVVPRGDVGPEAALRPLHGWDGVLPRATGDIRATQQLLGHEDIATTADIYVRPGDASLDTKLHPVYEPNA